MDGSPRRSIQANRQARRQSPYARPAAPIPQATPSRLRSVLSYLSPFRSSRKQVEEEEEETDDQDEEQQGEGSVKDEDTDSADEAAQFALHGRTLPRESSGIFQQQLPASPTPHNQLKRLAGPSNLASSFSMPDLASLAASPRARGNFARSPTHSDSMYGGGSEHGASGGATEELARFFREKAERGEEGLTAVEQAGVMHLMQQAQAIPTAFTPNFANSTTSFSPAPPAHFAPSNQTNGGPVYKRRRPLYVGAGYSSRRRKAATSTGGMSKSQSEGALSSLASGSNSDGKRRRTEEDETEEDIPVASLDDVLVSAPIAPPASSSSTSNNSLSTEKAQDKLKSKPSLSRFTGTTTPAKPSPLWQVSKADTPSPSPPRKPSSRAHTGAANLMLDVISQVDAANPPPKTKVAAGKEAILNPYDNDENPLALASKRTPRSSGSGRSKSATPRRAAKGKTVEVEKPKEKEISPLEQLERTMPAEYRRDTTSKRSKSSASPAPPPPEPRVKEKKKKAVEVVELLSSDAEEEVEMEEDQLDEDADEEMSPAPVVPPPASKRKADKPSSGFSFAPSATVPSTSKSTSTPSFGSSSATPSFSFGATSTTSSNAFGSSTSTAAPQSLSLNFGTPASASPSPKLSPSRDKLSPSPSGALTPPPADRPSSPKASLPPTPPPTSVPFSFSIPPPSFTVPSVPSPSSAESNSTSSPRDQIASLPKSSLPLHEFDFSTIFSSFSTGSEDVEDASVRAVKDLVRNMGKGELPSFAF